MPNAAQRGGMKAVKRVLVVDDEAQITRVLRSSLIAHRYDVRTAADAFSALDTFHDWHPDLIITDLQMPEIDGVQFCREVRKESQVPIIVLSVRGSERSKVEALDAGADDYVTKPFGIEELLARVRATLRRAPAQGDADSMLLMDGDVRIDLAKRSVSVLDVEHHLTPKEFDLFVFLFRNRGKVLTHRAILGEIWGPNSTEQTEYLRVFMGNLRKKLEADPTHPVTEPWVGYRLLVGDE